MNVSRECLGCRLANKLQQVHVVYEDEYVCCFLDHDPINEGHTLILSKKHYLDVDELDMETANAIMKASMMISKALKRVFSPDGITICQNGGKFNDLGHYHMHVVPRYEGEPFYTDEWNDNTEEKKKLAYTKAKLIDSIKEFQTHCFNSDQL
jgi:histidine triad (HIT) family protein